MPRLPIRALTYVLGAIVLVVIWRGATVSRSPSPYDVVFSGDSITAWAYGEPPIQSKVFWPPAENDTSFPQLLDLLRSDVNVTNIAVSGETSLAGLDRLRADLPDASPGARIYLLEGVNDPVFIGCDYRPRRSVRNVLRQGRYAARKGYVATVMTMTPVPPRITPRLDEMCGRGFWSSWRDAFNGALLEGVSRRRWRGIQVAELAQLFTEEEWVALNTRDLHPRNIRTREVIAGYLAELLP